MSDHKHRTSSRDEKRTPVRREEVIISKPGKDGMRGCRGKRGKRGHRGPEGDPGLQGNPGMTVTGPTGPCCTGPTGPTGPGATGSGLIALFEKLTGDTTIPNFPTTIVLASIPITSTTGKWEFLATFSFTLGAGGSPGDAAQVRFELVLSPPAAGTILEVANLTAVKPAAAEVLTSNGGAMVYATVGNGTPGHPAPLAPGAYTLTLRASVFAASGGVQALVLDDIDHAALYAQEIGA